MDPRHEETINDLYIARDYIIDAEVRLEDYEDVSGCILTTRRAVATLERVLEELERTLSIEELNDRQIGSGDDPWDIVFEYRED